ncbi:cysteine desulfurase [Granulicatella adiacens ATCC 49175]|uniref:Aminotransferase, class V n=1 Tax=Granulicatella adiacens ATCC 49175 TaxID=638301 RepID=C8NF11_9LACT|nr:cysteine desulfurase family protein [Granulicatella adiacens]EEW37720.1 aminotransferase, class V [Granulicatella adiacens ATCC 49175]UAK93625.1 cysteine desulfurase [Granulicatella adiacens]UWP37378.1 cysteine desulfurase [Granulicatella adiacens ATCC 49175]
MIYFDNAATTKIYDDALTSYVQVSQKFFGNPSSLHQLGVDAYQVLTKARAQVASLLSVQPEEIFFTSGGTESNNWAIKGTALEKSVFGKHIITTKIEHPSVLQTCKQLERFGFEVTYLDVDSKGIVSVDQLKENLRKDTILVSVMAVNNEVGAVQPIAEIAKVLEEYPSIHFHVDAVQAVERASQLLAIGRIDLLSLSAHKFHGPRGVGIMYKKFGRKIQALLTGGGQEKGERSTTENLPGIVATTKALRMTLEEKSVTGDLRSKLWKELATKPEIRIFSPEDGASHVLCFAIKGVRGEVVVHAFENHGIYISTTSACSSKKADSSSTLYAMDVPTEWATGAVRVSFSNDNTKEEVEQFINVLHQLMKQFSFLK